MIYRAIQLIQIFLEIVFFLLLMLPFFSQLQGFLRHHLRAGDKVSVHARLVTAGSKVIQPRILLLLTTTLQGALFGLQPLAVRRTPSRGHCSQSAAYPSTNTFA